jgi:cell filamentation protein
MPVIVRSCTIGLAAPLPPEFVDGLADLLADINARHPFREDNGRTQRTFLAQLARAAGHPVRWAAMDPAVRNL